MSSRRLQEAADCFARAAEGMRELGYFGIVGRAEERLAETLLELGDSAGAAAAYRRSAEGYAAGGAEADAERVRALAAAAPA